jgi:hypothetical protein
MPFASASADDEASPARSAATEFFRELARPPGQLDRDPLEVAEDAGDFGSLQAPGVEADKPDPARLLEAVGQVEPRACDDEHLDVGEIVCNAAGDASRQYDLFDNRWECGRDPPCDRMQFTRTSCRHSANLASHR